MKDIDSSGAVIQTSTYYAKNRGTSNEMLRLDTNGTKGNLIYIVNGVQQKAWVYTGGTWTNLSAEFTTIFNQTNTAIVGYQKMAIYLTGIGGSYTYTEANGEGTIVVYNVLVNPSLPDSLFQPPTS
ncbi:MAG: hypothetical protein ABSB40_03135 [Nitrososphaeria archaeon]